MSNNNNLTFEDFLQIQKCNKMVDILMWTHGYSKPSVLIDKAVKDKYDIVMNKYEECLNNISIKEHKPNN